MTIQVEYNTARVSYNNIKRQNAVIDFGDPNMKLSKITIESILVWRILSTINI